MIDTQNLKFACAFCNYSSDYKRSVKTHFRNCPEKYKSRIDLINPNFFRMIDAKYCIKDIKIKDASIFLYEKINMLKRHNALTASKILIDHAFIELQKREMILFK